MVRKQLSRHRFVMGLMVFCCLLVVAACGGGSGGGGPEVAAAENVDTGQPLQAGDWTIELTKPPEKTKIVGEGDITYQADGSFLLVFADVTNGGDAMEMVGRNLFVVKDGQGEAYVPVKSAVQVAYVLQHGLEPSLDSPLGAGKTRESVIIFDVPIDASDLVFSIDGADETLNLGF